MSDRRDCWIVGVEAKLVSALAAAAAGTPHEWDPPAGLPDGAGLVPDITVPPEPMLPGYPPLPWSDITTV